MYDASQRIRMTCALRAARRLGFNILDGCRFRPTLDARASAWYSGLPWIFGCNFIPSTAVNQLEHWQADTFDPVCIRRELELAASAGMNAVRVFLHDLAHAVDPAGLLERMDLFLAIARDCGIRTAFVLFDDCWHPPGAPGPQPMPVPGVHNSRWLQAPGLSAALDPLARERLERYVRDVVGRFRNDERVLFWDIYNEIGNFFLPLLSLPWQRRLPRLAARFLAFRFSLPPTLPLLEQAFAWARAENPVQPLTSGVWFDHPRLNRRLLELSDLVSFHNYEPADRLVRQIERLQATGRPLMCTEFLARSAGSRFESHLPVFQERSVGAFCWGLVSGKTQTIYSWSARGSNAEPKIWYHDIFRADGTPFDADEIEFLRRSTRAARDGAGPNANAAAEETQENEQ